VGSSALAPALVRRLLLQVAEWALMWAHSRSTPATGSAQPLESTSILLIACSPPFSHLRYNLPGHAWIAQTDVTADVR
jgi:hypothetical protein